MRLLVYSHDAYGLGNIRRMLAICESLLKDIPGLSILLLSGSPMVQSFRLPKGLDYIKLPCLNRGETGNIATKYLQTDSDQIIQLRSDLILSAAVHFKPDLFLVDKKPFGLQNEIKKTVKYLRSWCPKTKIVLLLRDILDAPAKTMAEWQKTGFHAAVEKYYDQLLVVGSPEVFDFVQEYRLPPAIANKVKFCGYMGRPQGRQDRSAIRQELQVLPEERLVVVTPGGGEDGYPMIHNYLLGLKLLPANHNIKSLIISGPEMSVAEREKLSEMAEQYPHVQMVEFTDDLISYLAAADTIVSMGGYNTICEILSAQKPAVVIPRVRPSQEQLVRAEKMTQLGLFKAVHPDQLNPDSLIQTLLQQLSNQRGTMAAIKQLNLDALPQITCQIYDLVNQTLPFKPALKSELVPMAIAA
ncbi:MAG: glycosyltransferase [Aphanocapsa sp. GSE-SYN-MK-11-07L]|nr:glycosyltransferase [Aphanocapsa sp. GSE-SYN-MK-11-07L]